MHKIKKAYIPFCVLFALAFHFLYSAGRIQFSVINLLFFSVAVSGYIYGRTALYVLTAISWVVVFPIIRFFYGIDLVNAIMPLILFNVLTAGSYFCRVITDDVVEEQEKLLSKKNESIANYTARLARLTGSENRIREKELAILKLYEMTKKMSAGLKLEALFSIFSSLLRENFSFSRCELFTLKNAGSAPSVDRVLTATGADNDVESEQSSSTDQGELIRMVASDPKVNYFERPDCAAVLESLKVRPSAGSLCIIPILSEKKPAGILTIEDLSGQDVEKAVIVSAQLALEMKKALLYEKVEELAMIDSLTGLFVRRYFLERLEEEAKRSKRYGFGFSFLMIDIDDFKKRNDTYGHLVGDVLLKEVGRVVKESVREIDLVARYGGEEFSLILPETTREGAKVVAERIRDHVEKKIFKAYDEELRLTVSLGLSMYPEDSDNPKELIEKADVALYKAKGSGKNLVREWEK